MKTVLITDYAWPDLEIETQVLEGAGYKLVAGPQVAASDKMIAELAARHRPSAIMTCWANVSAASIEACPDLEIVARIGVGLDNINREAAAARNVVVTNVPDYCVEEVSDHALAFLLAFARGVVAYDRDTKAGQWRPSTARLTRVRDMTVGVAGYGRIGRRTSEKVSIFGSTVLAFDSNPPGVADKVRFVSLDDLAQRSDAIIVHLPLTKHTQYMLDARFFRRMKKSAIFINVSRGALVRNEALLEALNHGTIAGAALDVIDGEPHVPQEIIDHPNVIATPHIAFSSTSSIKELRRRASEEIVRVLAGQAPSHPCHYP